MRWLILKGRGLVGWGGGGQLAINGRSAKSLGVTGRSESQCAVLFWCVSRGLCCPQHIPTPGAREDQCDAMAGGWGSLVHTAFPVWIECFEQHCGRRQEVRCSEGLLRDRGGGGGHWSSNASVAQQHVRPGSWYPPPLQMHTPAHTSQCWSRQTPARTRSVHLDAPGQRHVQKPVSRTADPGVVKQDKSSRGSVDTTKRRSDPQRVRMSSGERPIGAAKGKQSDTETLCHPPPPPGKY